VAPWDYHLTEGTCSSPTGYSELTAPELLSPAGLCGFRHAEMSVASTNEALPGTPATTANIARITICALSRDSAGAITAFDAHVRQQIVYASRDVIDGPVPVLFAVLGALLAVSPGRPRARGTRPRCFRPGSRSSPTLRGRHDCSLGGLAVVRCGGRDWAMGDDRAVRWPANVERQVWSLA
jgi:hypothetical protein